MNVCTLMGRTCSDIELKTTPTGVSVCSFSIAVDRKYTPKGQERQTDFIKCVAWRNTAEFLAKWFHKGDMIAVVGEVQTRNYEDKDGNKRTAVEVVIDTAYFAGGKKNEAQQTAPSVAEPPVRGGYEFIETDDELPF